MLEKIISVLRESGLIASVGSCLDEASSSEHDDGYINLIYRPFQTTLESDTDCILLCLCCAFASGTWLTDRESIISVRRRLADAEVDITEPPGVKKLIGSLDPNLTVLADLH